MNKKKLKVKLNYEENWLAIYTGLPTPDLDDNI